MSDLSGLNNLQRRYQNIIEGIGQEAQNRDVTLVAVSKYATLQQMMLAWQLGIHCFGESRVQTALAKQAAWKTEKNWQEKKSQQDISWHYIGTLQRNKLRQLVGRFQLIQSVHSLAMAKSLSEEALKKQCLQPVLLQLNFSDDVSRNGFLPAVCQQAFQELSQLQGIQINGLMTMAPPELSLSQNTQALKQFFNQVRFFREKLEQKHQIPLPELSMGMSNDYREALSCGSTMIRIGNALFKNENLTYNNKSVNLDAPN
jgi:PLP dependent protein